MNRTKGVQNLKPLIIPFSNDLAAFLYYYISDGNSSFQETKKQDEVNMKFK